MTDLNRKTAELMGWTEDIGYDERTYPLEEGRFYFLDDGSIYTVYKEDRFIWSPATDYNQAFMLVEELGLAFNLKYSYKIRRGKKCYCSFWSWDHRVSESYASSIPEAICLAYIQAKESE